MALAASELIKVCCTLSKPQNVFLSYCFTVWLSAASHPAAALEYRGIHTRLNASE
jgi:hypothetical protein